MSHSNPTPILSVAKIVVDKSLSPMASWLRTWNMNIKNCLSQILLVFIESCDSFSTAELTGALILNFFFLFYIYNYKVLIVNRTCNSLHKVWFRMELSLPHCSLKVYVDKILFSSIFIPLLVQVRTADMILTVCISRLNLKLYSPRKK